ncbi:phosphonate ABC transporter, permease protein PhnE [Halalkalibacter alkaliphilus]|uniref:Phosphonate ABC transporter, permease protein PhnE n=1 Tax=Halalkalibacter alkaliphilus TaxID=2917993 RepID=A0A9X2A4K4_9BACI|nr:phosphonate ABC transporter, permease protein PhnE [Halalkalibacter alkaliphilus]MCL7746852.1 phosphonate ABC transporter, permease protein PhnE [Halalkalibacter alkaliphilus]
MMKPPNTKQPKKTQNLIFLFLAIAFFVFSMLQLNIVPERILSSIDRMQYVLSNMFPPVLNEPIDIAGAAIESIQVAILGTIFGVIISIILAVFAAKNLTPSRYISYAIKSFAGFVRAVPALVWALLFIVAVGLGPTPGILALAINSVGMLVKVYAEALEEIDMGVVEALDSAGASRLQVILQGVIPSILSAFIAWSLFRFDVNIRYSAILGVVGAGGIGWELMKAAQMARYNEALMVTIVIFLMVMSAELISEYFKKRTTAATAAAMK